MGGSLNSYQKNHSLAIRFSEELTRQLNSLIASSEIKLGFPIQSRVKSWGSIDEKIDRLNLKLKSIDDLQDIVGLRLTLVFLRDANKIKSLLENTFDIVKSYNTSARLKNDQFGYSSQHIILKCPNDWCAVPSLSHLSNFKAEIQIRTLAQHIWAEVSHQLQYKNEENVPGEILRSIYRSSALLETIDLEFERVLNEREKYREEIKKDKVHDEMPINSDNLELLLDELLPKDNKDEDGENYSLLISDIKALEIREISKLRDIIVNNYDAMMKEEATRVKESIDDYETTGELTGTRIERLKRMVFYTHLGLIRTAFKKEYGEKKVSKIIQDTYKSKLKRTKLKAKR